MRIKLTLRGRGAEGIDLQVTADNTATAGDVAAALATAGPTGSGAPVDPESVTLRIIDPLADRVLNVLSPTALVTESGLRSGAVVDIVDAQQSTGSGSAKAAELRVLAGPDRGMVVPLPFGSTTVGRSRTCDVTLTDRLVSKRHMRVTVGAGVEVHDLNSANGVVVGDQRVQRTGVGAGDDVLVGDTTLRITQVRKPDAGLAESTDIGFTRPPQLLPRVGVQQVKVPQAPEAPDRGRFPVLAMIAPLVMGAVMFAVTRQLLSVVFVALSPLLMIGNWIDLRWQERSARKRGLESFSGALSHLREELDGHRRAEVEARHSQYPSIDRVVTAVLRRDGLLWARRPENPEFLRIRLGTGGDAASVEFEVDDPGRGIPECVAAAQSLVEEFSTLQDVPVVADLRASGGLGLCGTGEWLQQVQCAVVGQVVSLYSPAEVVIACLTSGERLPGWQWLEWLPHVSSPHSPLDGIHLAADPATGTELLASLEGLLDARSGDGAGTWAGAPHPTRGPEGSDTKDPTYPNTLPAVLVVVDGSGVDRARLNRLAERGPDHGIYFVWCAEDFNDLPAACRTFVAVDDRTGAVGEVRRSRVVQPVTLDRLPVVDAARLARSLAPIVDAGVPVDDDSDLPGSISYVQMTGHELADNSEAALERWRASGSVSDRSPGAQPRAQSPVSLAALVGQGVAAPVSLDLRTQGPHALVGGTTGAGKSEFLQAWVLGMAQALSPDRVTFLFVDYKGGSAFARCTDLPHFVGLVTDLSPYMVRRALTSLRAELHHREKLLNAKNAKDLVTLEKRGDPDCPPSLVIVIDEFAALVGEVPEFVDGVVDVAQRGRSLGLHLILATQRPAGVIKDNLRANTNLRVALRMADEADSQDVLGDVLAAHFPQGAPGRGAAKTGPGRITVFQSAYPGARTTQEAKVAAVGVEELGFGSPRAWQVAEAPRPSGDVAQDIDRVVDTLRKAADAGGIPEPRRPWLPDLAQTYNIRNLRQRTDSELVLGVIDVPEDQAQVAEYFRPDREGNIAYYGASGSGKTTALRSLAIAAAITPRGGPVDVYGIDFAGGGLDMLRALPHVGDVVPGDDEERVSRLVDMLAGLVEERAARYSAVRAADLGSYRRISGRGHEPRMLLLVDGIGVLAEEYQASGRRLRTWNRFQQILLDGRAVGVHVAATADRQQAVPSSLASNFQRKVVLRQTDEDAYLFFGLPKDVLDPTSLPGRAMQVGRPQLLQLAILGDNINALAQARLMEQLGGFMTEQGRVRPPAIGSLPQLVEGATVAPVQDGQPVIGIDGETLAPLGFRPVGTLCVGGAPQTGRSNAVAWVVHALRSQCPGAMFLHASSGRSALVGRFRWKDSAKGSDEVARMLQGSRALFEEAAPEGTPGVVLVVEGFADLVYTAADQELAEVIGLARSNGHLVVGEADLVGWGRGGGLSSALRGGRAGIVLCPALGDGDTVLGTGVPAVPGREMTPGRGYFAQGGKVHKIQVPLLV